MKNIFLFLFFISISFSLSLYSNFYKNKQKCYYENFYNDSVIIIRYKILDEDLKEEKLPPTKLGNRFVITLYSNKKKNIVNIFASDKLSAKFSQTIEESGEYKLCIESRYNDIFQKKMSAKLSFNIDTSEDLAEQEEGSAKMKDFQEVNKKVQRLNRKTDDFNKMQEYQAKVEEEFSQNQMSSAKLLATISIIQMVIIFIIGIYQVIMLQKAFKSNTLMFS